MDTVFGNYKTQCFFSGLARSVSVLICYL